VARLLGEAASDGTGGLDAFVRLALMSGARRAELLEVRWPDLGWPTTAGDSGTLAIGCHGGKTSAAWRTIALDLGTMDVLGTWRGFRRALAREFRADFGEDGYVFALWPGGLSHWPEGGVTRRVVRTAAQTGVLVTVSDLRRYSMGRLPALGVGLNVISHRLGLSAGPGMVTLSSSAGSLAAADRRAALLLGRELDQALAALAPAGSGPGRDG